MLIIILIGTFHIAGNLNSGKTESNKPHKSTIFFMNNMGYYSLFCKKTTNKMSIFAVLLKL